jgi:hypothetical protein
LPATGYALNNADLVCVCVWGGGTWLGV